MFVLSACSRGESTAQPARVALACPTLQSSLGYSVRTLNGPDYLECTMAPLRAGVVPAKLYVGNYPYPQHELQFVGFTTSPMGALVWFSSVANGERHWVTYIPTGYEFPSVVMLWVESRNAPSLSQLGAVAGIVVSHSPNISIQRTRYARR